MRIGSHFAERHPVRQKRYPSYPYPNYRIGGESESRKINWSKVWNPSNGCLTFFFRNFLETCTVEMLYKRFNDIGRVRDVFIPRKRDGRGNKYGFVRFGADVDSSRIEEDLNKVWFGSFKMRANKAKFKRGYESGRNIVQRTNSLNVGQTIWRPSWRKEGRSYVEASTVHFSDGVSNPIRKNSTPDFYGIRFESDKMEKDKLINCFTGCLKDELEWSECEATIRQLCEKKFKIDYTGGDLILLRPQADSITVEDIPNDLFEWLEFVRPWSDNDVSLRRRIWTRWYGIPVHAWMEKFSNWWLSNLGRLLKLMRVR